MMKIFVFDITFQCDNLCIFCVRDTERWKIKEQKNELTLQQIYDVFWEYPPEKEDIVIISGGEPTLHSQLHQIIELCKSKTKRVIMLTNGNRLSDLHFLKGLMKTGVDELTIPIHGFNSETHERITHIKGSFQKVDKAISNILQLKKEGDGPYLRLKLIISKSTIPYLHHLWEFIQRNPGYDELMVSFIVPCQKALESNEVFDFSEKRAEIVAFLRTIISNLPLRCRLQIRGLDLGLLNDPIGLLYYARKGQQKKYPIDYRECKFRVHSNVLSPEPHITDYFYHHIYEIDLVK